MLQRGRLIMVLGLALVVLAGCQGAQEKQGFDYMPVFGDGSNDVSSVVAVVNGDPITEFELQLRYDELPPQMQRKFQGPEGLSMLLQDMIDDLLMVQGAAEEEIYNLQAVRRTLITQQRQTLIMAMQNLNLLKDQEPSDEELQDYYLAHRDEYQKQGMVKARHIELLSQEDADEAYARIASGEWKDRFEVVCKEMSVNPKTKAEDGELGWFNRGGFVPDVEDHELFATKVYDLDNGLNPPIRVGDRWHVVEIRQRERDRPMTFQEARLQVLNEVKPAFQQRLLKEYLAAARDRSEITYEGQYAPGGGLTPDELLAKARALGDFDRKQAVLQMIYNDFPESDRADDALFLEANLLLEKYSDRRDASRLLTRLVRDYPQSDLIDDAQYLLENMNNPDALAPSSIEDLRK